MVKHPLANARDARDVGSTPGSEKSPGVGNGKPLQCSCLENSMDRGGWWATGHGVANTTEQLSRHTHWLHNHPKSQGLQLWSIQTTRQDKDPEGHQVLGLSSWLS